MNPNIHVSSETGRLRKVIVHQPDDGIEIVTPSKALEFLYDDIVYLPLMREEHKVFTDILKHFAGEENVLDTQDMLLECIENNFSAREELIDAVVFDEDCSEENKQILKGLSPEELIYTLYTGMVRSSRKQIFGPLPNNIFTRDIGAVVNDHVIICQASKGARTRESVLTRILVNYHSVFESTRSENKIIDLTKEDDDVTLEGGDLMIYNNDYLLVGCSERTSLKALDVLIDKLFEKDVVKSVVWIEIPKERTCMHIDTLFTQLSKNEFVVYAPYVASPEKIEVTAYHKDGSSTSYKTLLEFFRSVNKKTEYILCGNGEYPFDEREQWTDGCNLVCVKDGVAFSYQRNYRTAEALRNRGYNIVDGWDVLTALESGLVTADKIEKTIIRLSATELSRARGGPHCMTFPLLRDDK
jgi:arginine deiminase